jgi:hypothetical protein
MARVIGGFKVKKNVTVALFKLVPGEDNFFHVQGSMHIGEKIGDREPATLMHVINMQTGEEGQIICPTILQKELAKQYENDTYVGKRFWLRITRVPEKKYNMVEISELEDEDAVADSSAETEKQPTKSGKNK